MADEQRDRELAKVAEWAAREEGPWGISPSVEILARVIMDLKARVEALEGERDRQSANQAWAGKAKVSRAAREFAEGIDREPEGRP